MFLIENLEKSPKYKKIREQFQVTQKELIRQQLKVKLLQNKNMQREFKYCIHQINSKKVNPLNPTSLLFKEYNNKSKKGSIY